MTVRRLRVTTNRDGFSETTDYVQAEEYNALAGAARAVALGRRRCQCADPPEHSPACPIRDLANLLKQHAADTDGEEFSAPLKTNCPGRPTRAWTMEPATRGSALSDSPKEPEALKRLRLGDTAPKVDLSKAEVMDMTLDEAMARSRALIERVQAEHNPVATLGLFSGGNDSTTLMHFVRPFIDHAVHINTGIGIEQTRQFVRDTCAGLDLDLIEEHPPPGATYRELVLRYGFPGPAGHQLMYTRLKERGLRAVRRRFITNGRKQRVVFLAGMRLAESSRRWMNTEETHREGSVVWCSPLAHWSNANMAQYRRRFTFPRNEVNDHLHMSGECLCGAFARRGELEQIRFFYPETAAMIEALEAEAREAGVHAEWGTRPPRKLPGHTRPVGPLCQQCLFATEEATK